MSYFCQQVFQIIHDKGIASDIFEWNKQKYLLVIDYYSRFTEVTKLYAATSRDVITIIRVSLPNMEYQSHSYPTMVHSILLNYLMTFPENMCLRM